MVMYQILQDGESTAKNPYHFISLFLQNPSTSLPPSKSSDFSAVWLLEAVNTLLIPAASDSLFLTSSIKVKTENTKTCAFFGHPISLKWYVYETSKALEHEAWEIGTCTACHQSMNFPAGHCQNNHFSEGSSRV